jgi:D-sedoheptulose 7-phosphate isomerase
MQFYDTFYDTVHARLRDVPPQTLEEICDALRATHGSKRKVIVAGNGGSSAIASHVSVDLTKCAGVRSVSFNEADLITCFGNDFGYENWLARALELYGDPGDMAVLISSSGKSPNIVNAARAAKAHGMRVVTLSGFDADNPLRALGDHNLWVNSRGYNIVETVHQTWLLACIDRIISQAEAPATPPALTLATGTRS